jgi:hypothetical protein
MLRVESHRLANTVTLRLEGRFVGDWAEQARSLVTKSPVPAQLVVDLTEVSYADSIGEQVLIWLRSIGATFIAGSCYALDVCERLQLPLEREASSSPARR